MNANDVLIAAITQVRAYSNESVAPESIYYRRIGIHQQELFSLAATINAEYFSVEAEGTLDVGGVDLDLMVDPVLELERLQRVEIGDPGTSGYAAGQKVAIVTLEDPDAGFAPRCRILNRKIRGYGAELDSVTSVVAFYSYRPKLLAADEAGTTVILIPSPHTELLVLDCAMYAIRRILSIPADKRQEIISILSDDYKVHLSNFHVHIKEFAVGLESRFGPSSAIRK